jgi:hypothetical protein
MPVLSPLTDDHRDIIKLSVQVAALLKTNPATVNLMLMSAPVAAPVSVERMVGLLRYTARDRATLTGWAPYLERVTAELVARKVDPAVVLKGLA